jgi:hypothetical protein
LPDDFVKLEHEETLRANKLCTVRCVQRLREGKLEALGISMGDAMMLLDVLHVDVVPAPPAGAPAKRAGAPQQRRPEMRPFPKCGMTQYPDLEGWSVYKTGLGLRAAPAMTAVGAAALKLVLGGAEVPGPWADGCADDVMLFTELVNGNGAMPDDLLRLVPKAMKDSSAGLMVLYHLNSRV